MKRGKAFLTAILLLAFAIVSLVPVGSLAAEAQDAPGELSAYASAPDLTSTSNSIYVGDTFAEIYLPEISGTPAELSGDYVMPTVTWSVNGVTGTDNDAYKSAYEAVSGTWETPRTLQIDASILEEGELEGSDSYYIIHADGTLEVGGGTTTGNWSSDKRPPWQKYADRIVKLTISRGTEIIGAESFSELPCLETAVIPETVQFVGDGAFANDTSLSGKLVIAKNARIEGNAFCNTAISGVVLDGDPLQNPVIADNAFRGCSSLTYVAAYDEDFNVRAFSDCPAITTVYIHRYGIGDEAGRLFDYFGKGIRICTNSTGPDTEWRFCYGYCGDDVMYELSYSYDYRLNIYGSGRMFDYITNEETPWNGLELDTVTIGDKVEYIGAHSFENQEDIDVHIGNVKEIGDYAFQGSNIDEFRRTSGVPSVDDFQNIFLDDLTRIGESAFANCHFRERTLIFQQSVGRIENNAFANANGFRELMFPLKVGYIDANAFAGCNEIRSVAFEGQKLYYRNSFGADPSTIFGRHAEITYGGQGVAIADAPIPNPESNLEYSVITGFDASTGEELPEEVYIVGLTAGQGENCLTVGDFIEGSVVAEGAELVVESSNGTILEAGTRLATGQIVCVISGENEIFIGQMVLRGDVLGNGELSAAQLVRMAQALNRQDPLSGCYLVAGDLAGDGSIDVTDLVEETKLLSAQ